MEFIKKYWVFIIAGLLVLLAFGMYITTFAKYGISNDSSQWDHFGSYVGGVFSGLAFLGVVYQLYITKLDQEKNDFEKTFFMMLEHHNNKLSELNNKNLINDVYDKLFNKNNFDKVRGDIERVLNKDLYTEFNVYFLNLYRILKYIEENNNLNVNLKYSSLLRSFLSRKMVVILAYHLCGRNNTYGKYIELINKFHFLEHINIDMLEYDFLTKTLLENTGNDELKGNISHLIYNLNDFKILGKEKFGSFFTELAKAKKERKEVQKPSINDDFSFLEPSNLLGVIFSKFKPEAFFDDSSTENYHKEKYGKFTKVYKDLLDIKEKVK